MIVVLLVPVVMVLVVVLLAEWWMRRPLTPMDEWCARVDRELDLEVERDLEDRGL